MVKINLRRVFGILLVALGVLSIIYCFSIAVFGVTFYKFFAVIGALFIVFGLGVIFIKIEYRQYKSSIIFKLSKIIFIFLVSSFLVIESFIVYHGGKNDNNKVDYLVVLGAGLWGETPSLALRQRLDESLIFINQNPDTKVILTGGMGPGETITEAEGMKRYLVQNGVNENLLIKEDKATSTKENLKFTKELLKKIDKREKIKIKVITNNFHMFRAKLLAKNNGFEVYGQPAPLHPLLVPAYYIREYMAVIKSFLFDFI